MTPPSPPPVSVCIPTYQGEQCLPAALASVLAQDFRDFELVVIDDGSTDGTWDLLQEYARRDPRIQPFRRERNGGEARARNDCLQKARGALIAWLDHDDIALPNRLALQMAEMAARPNLAALGGAYMLVERHTGKRRRRLPRHGPELLRHLHHFGACLYNPTVMARRAAQIEIGGYRPFFAPASDFDMWMRISERFDVDNLPDCLVEWANYPEQTSRSRRLRTELGAAFAVMDGHRRRTGAPPLPVEEWGAPDMERLVSLLATETLPADLHCHILARLVIAHYFGTSDDPAAARATIPPALASLLDVPSWPRGPARAHAHLAVAAGARRLVLSGQARLALVPVLRAGLRSPVGFPLDGARAVLRYLGWISL